MIKGTAYIFRKYSRDGGTFLRQIKYKMLKEAGIILVLLAAQGAMAQSRSKIDLDDMMIKGELRNDDRLMILARQKEDLKNYVKFRKNFRKEMLEELPVMDPRQPF
jgi:hypothetical protein